MLFVCYPKCSTCKRAQAWLAAQGIEAEVRDIRENNPNEEELRRWHAMSGLPLKRFFNTSGQQFALLATDGMLVKRPILVGEESAYPGFKEEVWAALK